MDKGLLRQSALLYVESLLQSGYSAFNALKEPRAALIEVGQRGLGYQISFGMISVPGHRPKAQFKFAELAREILDRNSS